MGAVEKDHISVAFSLYSICWYLFNVKELETAVLHGKCDMGSISVKTHKMRVLGPKGVIETKITSFPRWQKPRIGDELIYPKPHSWAVTVLRPEPNPWSSREVPSTCVFHNTVFLLVQDKLKRNSFSWTKLGTWPFRLFRWHRRRQHWAIFPGNYLMGLEC